MAKTVAACPVEQAILVIGGKWKLLVLRSLLLNGPQQYFVRRPLTGSLQQFALGNRIADFLDVVGIGDYAGLAWLRLYFCGWIALPGASCTVPCRCASTSSSSISLRNSGELTDLLGEVVSDFSVGLLFGIIGIFSIGQPLRAPVQNAVDRTSRAAEPIIQHHALVCTLRGFRVSASLDHVARFTQALRRGLCRYTELAVTVTAISQKELTRNLRELSEAGLVEREAGARRTGPYHLTPLGKGLMPTFQSLLTWGAGLRAAR